MHTHPEACIRWIGPIVLNLLLFLLLSSGEVQANLVGRPADYYWNDMLLHGELISEPAVITRRPAVLVVHDWWGMDEQVRRRARMLAESGYVAMVVDLYGETPVNVVLPDKSEQFSAQILKNKQLLSERLNAAIRFLKEQPEVDPGRIAAVGYGLGGAVVLHLARSGVDLKGVVSFYAGLTTDSPAVPGGVLANILVFNGDHDHLVTQGQVHEFLGEMTLSGAPFRFISYRGAQHGFANPDSDKYAKLLGMPLRYDRQADQGSWSELLSFLNEIFKDR